MTLDEDYIWAMYSLFLNDDGTINDVSDVIQDLDNIVNCTERDAWPSYQYLLRFLRWHLIKE